MDAVNPNVYGDPPLSVSVSLLPSVGGQSLMHGVSVSGAAGGAAADETSFRQTNRDFRHQEQD